MADNNLGKPFDPGRLAPAGREPALAVPEIAALAAGLIWLVVAGSVIVFGGKGADGTGLGVLVVLLVLVMPVALIWVGVTAARSLRVLREESALLRASVDAMRQSALQHQHQQAAGADIRPAAERRPDEVTAAQRQTENVIATFASTRARAEAPVPAAAATKPAAPEAEQPSLALGATAEDLRPPLETDELIRALNFPETTEDREGFRALRRALEDRTASRLVRSAQDVLTLLSQEGIYMDDLTPDRARPEVWRRFAHGERGPGVAALGGVRDRSCLALTSARMKQDPIFRDVAHHFLRQFDRALSDIEQAATDQEISDLAETRTARAFMLLGRVTGMFG